MVISSNNQGEKMENYEGIFIIKPEVKDEKAESQEEAKPSEELKTHP